MVSDGRQSDCMSEETADDRTGEATVSPIVHLATVQPASMLRKLDAGESVYCDEEASKKTGFGDYATVCYDWIAGEMEAAGVCKPAGCDARWPLWAWAYRRNGRGMLADEVWGGPDDGIEYVVLGLEVPAGRILLSSFYDWSSYPFLTDGGLLMPSREDVIRIDEDSTGVEVDEWLARSDAATMREKEDSWKRVLRTVDDLRTPRRVDMHGRVPDGGQPVDYGMEQRGVISADGEYKPSADETWFDWLQATLWSIKPTDVKRVWRRGESLRGTASWLQWNQKRL